MNTQVTANINNYVMKDRVINSTVLLIKHTIQSNSVKYLYTVNIHYNIVNLQF